MARLDEPGTATPARFVLCPKLVAALGRIHSVTDADPRLEREDASRSTAVGGISRIFPLLKAEEGWMRLKKISRSLLSATAGVVLVLPQMIQQTSTTPSAPTKDA